MKADAVVVRWSDEVNQRYLMLASNCFPAEMQEDERSLLAGLRSRVCALMLAPGSSPSTTTVPSLSATARGRATATW